MKVLKFGGTSVGSAQRMKDVAKLITGERNIVVLSAMSGTTNSLVEISDYLYKKNPDGANEVINKLAQKYYGHIEELYSTDEYKQKAKELIKHHFDHIRTFYKGSFHVVRRKSCPGPRRTDLYRYDEPLSERMRHKLRSDSGTGLYAYRQERGTGSCVH